MTTPSTPRSVPDPAGARTFGAGFDITSLVGGVVVAVLTAVLALGDGAEAHARAVWPIVLLGVGVTVLAGARRR